MSYYSEIIDYHAVLMAVQHESKCVYHAPATEKEVAPPELSPAAKAVLDAVMQYEINPECYSREIAAAALRAAALYCKEDRIRLLVIAYELEAHFFKK